ncbi:hypothetical protein [Halobaculum litoreum]|uniref:Uncharacterized protein n=1 Tax=Halobaculum litoreum TaxID=3031998 RepID=A0ABD5XQ18_9EURY|nr:hypothetical protein [Halobaculum sp. DT92]
MGHDPRPPAGADGDLVEPTEGVVRRDPDAVVERRRGRRPPVVVRASDPSNPRSASVSAKPAWPRFATSFVSDGEGASAA